MAALMVQFGGTVVYFVYCSQNGNFVTNFVLVPAGAKLFLQIIFFCLLSFKLKEDLASLASPVRTLHK